MKVTGRNNHDHTTQAELTPEEMNIIFWAIRMDRSPSAVALRDDLCGMEAITVRFDGRGKNGL
jgi:hypothetical protein